MINAVLCVLLLTSTLSLVEKSTQPTSPLTQLSAEAVSSSPPLEQSHSTDGEYILLMVCFQLYSLMLFG